MGFLGEQNFHLNRIAVYDSDIQALSDEMVRSGFVWCKLSSNTSRDKLQIEAILRRTATPTAVFPAFGLWKDIGVDLTKDPRRSQGIGLNSLHIDCVNAQFPPTYVAFYCVRSDPAGGGANIFASTQSVETQLTPRSTAYLKRSIYNDGMVRDLIGVGHDANPFAVLDTHWGTRYTGRLLERPDLPPDAHAPLLELDRVLMQRSFTLKLDKGEAVIIDQRRFAHGRLRLGDMQEKIDPKAQRLLSQIFAI